MSQHHRFGNNKIADLAELVVVNVTAAYTNAVNLYADITWTNSFVYIDITIGYLAFLFTILVGVLRSTSATAHSAQGPINIIEKISANISSPQFPQRRTSDAGKLWV